MHERIHTKTYKAMQKKVFSDVQQVKEGRPKKNIYKALQG